MGETLSLFRSSFNKSRRIEPRPERLTGEPGAVLLREIMERTRIIEWLVERLEDPRKGDWVIYPLADLLRASLLLLGHAAATLSPNAYRETRMNQPAIGPFTANFLVGTFTSYPLPTYHGAL